MNDRHRRVGGNPGRWRRASRSIWSNWIGLSLVALIAVTSVAVGAAAVASSDTPDTVVSLDDVSKDVQERLRIEGGCSQLDAALVSRDIDAAEGLLDASDITLVPITGGDLVGLLCEGGAGPSGPWVDAVGVGVLGTDGSPWVVWFASDSKRDAIVKDFELRRSDARTLGADVPGVPMPVGSSGIAVSIDGASSDADGVLGSAGSAALSARRTAEVLAEVRSLTVIGDEGVVVRMSEDGSTWEVKR